MVGKLYLDKLRILEEKKQATNFREILVLLDLIESKTKGIFTLLDEESKLPKPSFDHFTLEVHKAWNGHFRLSLPRTSRLKAHRTLRDEEGFLVRHFAGAVCYTTVSIPPCFYFRILSSYQYEFIRYAIDYHPE